MNPLSKLEDVNGKEFILMRGTFNLSMDEWNLNMVEINYNVPTTTIGTSTIKTNP